MIDSGGLLETLCHDERLAIWGYHNMLKSRKKYNLWKPYSLMGGEGVFSGEK